VAADAVWPHTVSVLGIGGMAWAAAKQRWWLVGLFGGMVLWGRLHAALVVAVVGLLLGWYRRSPRITAEIGAVSAVMLGLVCVWTRWWIGSWNPISSYGADIFEGANTGSKHFTSIVTQLVSPDRGILVWTPVLLLLTPALVRGWREVPDWARALLFGGIAYTLAQAWIADPLGGDSFYGYRHGIELIVAATPAYAITAHHVGATARKWIAPVLALQFCAMVFGSMVDVFLPKEDAWHDNAFFYAIRESWPVGPLMFVGVVCVVTLAIRLLASRGEAPARPTADQEPARMRESSTR
jgi:alpha-1,2-mannosyltransferase